MLVIGLTGGIASGKTTVANLFSKKNITLIDTDVIARELVEPSMPAYKEMIQHFSHDILLTNGTINRKKLRNIIFNNESEKKWLENLLHPQIRNRVEQDIKKSQSPYCIVVIPLLAETWPNPYVNHVLVVEAKPEVQIHRVVQRDNVSPIDAQKIIENQNTAEQRRKIAHDIISNNSDIDALQKQVDTLHDKYLLMATAGK